MERELFAGPTYNTFIPKIRLVEQCHLAKDSPALADIDASHPFARQTGVPTVLACLVLIGWGWPSTHGCMAHHYE